MFDFKGAIFDLDGTLLDSLGIWKKIDIDFLSRRNLPVTDEYTAAVSSLGFREAAEYTISLYQLQENAADIMNEWNEMALYEYSHTIQLKQNAKEYLLFLKQHHIKLGIATALPKKLYEPVLKNNNIYELFDALCSTDETNRGKGFPDVFLLAAQRLGVNPCDCIAFEDILLGIKGIQSANMRAYGVYDSYSAHEQEQLQLVADGYIYDFIELM